MTRVVQMHIPEILTRIEEIAHFNNTLRLEREPNDPPTPSAELAATLQHLPDFFELLFWGVWENQTLVASARLQHVNVPGMDHVSQLELDVLPQHRQHGLGRALLQDAVVASQAAGKTNIIAHSQSRIPAGATFLQRFGFAPGLETRISQLELAQLDDALLKTWISRAQERAHEYELGFWEGHYPQEQLPAICHLLSVMNTAPKGDLEIGDVDFTPEQLRQAEDNIFASGKNRITTYVQHQRTGELAGFSEITYNPKRLHALSQGGTGVFPTHRDLGLGRWLKAAALQWVRTNLPDAKYVRTGNAETNAPMLAINTELGFAPYFANTTWQAKPEAVLHALQPVQQTT